MTTRRFAVVAPSIDDTLNQYEPLLRAIKKRGHRILFCAPEQALEDNAKKDAARLNKLGIEFRPTNYETPGIRLLNDVRVTAAFKAIFRDWPPDCVFAIGYPAITHAVLAARRAGTQRIVSACDDLPATLNPMIGGRHMWHDVFLKRALAKSDTVLFYNHDHLDLMRQKKMFTQDRNVIVLPGSGVDLNSNPALPLPGMDEGLVFLMAAPLEAIRGVVNYIQAAKQVARQSRTAKFLLLGLPCRNALDIIDAGFAGPQFEVVDSRKRIHNALARAHVFVYPSHSEGMAFPTLEALAAGRPIITTNIPGCRESVDETVNGYLVPRGDITALVNAMSAILKRPDLIPAMARASRSKAERRFDAQMVSTRLLEVFGL